MIPVRGRWNRKAGAWARIAVKAVGCLAVVGLQAQPLRDGLKPLNQRSDLDVIAEGKALAEYYCALCHRYTEPSLLDKKTWIGQTLPRMKIRMAWPRSTWPCMRRRP